MEKFLFVPSIPQTEWLQGVLPGKNPAELPVAGRPIVDYVLERAKFYKATIAEILDFHPSPHLAALFNDPWRYYTATFYHEAFGPMPRGLDELAKVPDTLMHDNDGTLVVSWGMMLPEHEIGTAPEVPVSAADMASTPPGIYRRRDGKWMRVCTYARIIDGVSAWLDVNFKVLHSPEHFTLPGYSAEKGVYLGRNVVLEHGTEVKAPDLLQDGAWCARNVTLDGDVILGCGAFVGEGAHIARSVVCDNTYVGGDLELENKIVVGNRIIDAVSGEWTDIEEPGVAHSVKGDGVMAAIWHFLQGTSRGRRR